MVNEIFHETRIVPYDATDKRRMNIVPRLCRNNKQTRALLRPNEINTISISRNNLFRNINYII